MKKVTFLLSLFFLFAHPSFAQAPVLLDDGYYLIDSDGDTMNKYAYDYIHPRSGSNWLVIQNGSFNYIESSYYKNLSPNGFDIAYPFKGKFGLVGDSPRYHYISEKGVLLDTLDYAIQPKVYQNFLIYGDSVHRVADVDGAIIHRTLNPLFAASKVGIFEWDRDKKEVIQFYASYSSFRELRRFQNVDTLAFNHQGYAFIEQDGKFCVPGPTGELLFENQAASPYYLGVAIAWGKYLFLNRIEDVEQEFNNEISSFPMFNTSSCIFRNYPNRGNLGVELGEPFKSLDVARLPGGNKWVFYNASSRQVEGRYLFDEILPSNHKFLLLVRLEMDWYLYNRRNHDLQLLPWRFIHPHGLQSNRFFGNNSGGEFWGRTWAYQNLDSLNGGPEEYRFINSINNKMIRHPRRVFNSTLEDVHRITLGTDTIWLNQNGEIVAIEAKPSIPSLKPIDYISPQLSLSNKNIVRMENRRGYDRRKIQAHIKENAEGFLLELANTTKDTTHIMQNNGAIDIQLEYKVNDSTWRPISHSPQRFSDYSESISLAPMHKFSKPYRPAPGNFLVWVRLRVFSSDHSEIVSEPIRMKIPGAMIIGHRVPEMFSLGAWGQLIWAFDINKSSP